LYEVAGYPSVYFGDPESPELYHGELDYDSLVAFADQNLRTLPCAVKNLEACNEKVKRTIGKLQEKSLSELEAMEREVLKKVDQEQKRFDQAALKLQKQYSELANNFNIMVDKLRDDSDFKWIQQVLNAMYEDHENEVMNEQPDNDEL
jgi:Zn-dependent M32 family carboxypeptidase